MRGVLIAIVLVLAGCTAILDLHGVDSVDHDNDNVPDAIDNCPDAANPDQSDFDHNGKGDACDLCTDGGAEDVDQDGIPDGCDGCIGRGEDVDQDGIDDGCDACLGSGEDADHDNIDDACDACVGNGMDLDHDNIDDKCDTCVQKFTDTDGDSLDDGCDPCVASPPGVDFDHDGIEDACDPCAFGPQHDEDKDGVYDACDNCDVIANPGQANGDNDGCGDDCELGTDSDRENADAFAAQNASWYLLGSGWTLGNDVAQLRTTGDSARWLSQVTPDFELKTRVVYTQFGPNILPGKVSLIASEVGTLSPQHLLACVIDTNGTLTAIATFPTTGTQTNTAPMTFNSSGTVTLRMRASSKKDTMTCFAEVSGIIAFDVMASVTITEKSVPWSAGLAGTHVDATFDYFDQIFYAP